jgi:prepilin-type N-terminal cleavage/methylation domain-containing protein
MHFVRINRIGYKGFTLIELMVVVTILSFIILGLVTFFTGGTRSWISGQNQLKAQREARIAVDRMIKEIREANKVVNGYETGITVSYPSIFGRENVTFYLDIDSHSIKRNNNANTLVDHIPEGGFLIKYYDSEGNETTPTNASKIMINLKVDVDDDSKPDITIETEVTLRNYGMS